MTVLNRNIEVWRNVALALALLIGLHQANCQVLRTGDLLFSISGGSDFSNAINESTAGDSTIGYVHVAIVESDSVTGELSVIEASPKDGVQLISLSNFLARQPMVDNKPGVVVKRVGVNIPLERAIEEAKTHLGEPYDWWYLPDNGKMYCSELVYESFRDARGNKIFEAKPMNFRDKEGNMPEFWEALYRDLGVPVPEGLPGTNPNDMAASPLLIEIFRYF